MAKKKSIIICYGANGLELPGDRHNFSHNLLGGHRILDLVNGDRSLAYVDRVTGSQCAARAADGQWWWIERKVDYSLTPSLHACDHRCQHARGRSCQCSCRGANHGRFFRAEDMSALEDSKPEMTAEEKRKAEFWAGCVNISKRGQQQ